MNEAQINYENGYNCAQAILKMYEKELNISSDELMKIAQGLGSGMFIGETCGAVTASVMVLGLKKSSGVIGDIVSRKAVFTDVKNLESRFKEKYCSLNCRTLKTECKASCKNIVADSAEILKELI